MSSTSGASKSIQAIDPNSVHQITSGQVVIDLQTAVKELVENSLDAGATNIEVRFKNYGLKSVEVVDNGSGIQEDDFESIGRKHHTSKLSSFEDLTSITSFGFRGEAMSSLCALCESVTVTTAVADKAPMGTILELGKGGEILKRSKAPRQRGSTVLITTPFVSLPVRRKELERNIKREFGKALTLLNAYALGPCCGLSAGSSKDDDPSNKDSVGRGVRLVVTNQPDKGQKTTHVSLPLPSAGTQPSVRTGVTVLWGPKALDNVIDFQFEFQVPRITLKKSKKRQGTEDEEEEANMFPIRVKGIISSPVPIPGSNSTSRFSRTAADRQFFYVQKALNETYRSYTASNSAIPHFPLVIIDFNLPGDGIDVNVTPDKRTILVHAETHVIDGLRTSLEDLFSPTRSTYGVNGTQRSNSQKNPSTTQRSSTSATPNAIPQRTRSMPAPINVSDEDDSDKEAPRAKADGDIEGRRTESLPPKEPGARPTASPDRTRRTSSPTAPGDVDHRGGALPAPTSISLGARSKPCSVDDNTTVISVPFGIGDDVEVRCASSQSLPSTRQDVEISGTGARREVCGAVGASLKGKATGEVVVSTAGASWTRKVGLPTQTDDGAGGSCLEGGPDEQDELDEDEEPPRKKRKSIFATSAQSDEEVQVVGSSVAAKSRATSAKGRKSQPSRQLKLTDAFQPRTTRQDMRTKLAGFARSGSQVPTPASDAIDEEGEDEEMEPPAMSGIDVDDTTRFDKSVPAPPLFLPDEDGDMTMEDATSVAPATTVSSLTSNPPTSSSLLPASSSSSVIDLSVDSDDEEIDGSLLSSVMPDMTSSKRKPEYVDRPEVIRTSSTQSSGDIHLRFSLSEVTDSWAQLRDKLKLTRKKLKLSSNAHEASSGLAGTGDRSIVESPKAAEATLSRVIEKSDFSEMDVLGQFNLGFIIVRKRGRGTIGINSSSDSDGDPAHLDMQDDLFIVDQHAADEKYNFETLQQTCSIKSQKLFKPIPLDLVASDEILATENLDVLKRNGFEIRTSDVSDGGGVDIPSDDLDDDGRLRGSRLSLTALPISRGTIFDVKDLEELIHLLNDNPSGQMVRCSKARAMFASRACRKSVMVGMPLTKGQMTTNLGSLKREQCHLAWDNRYEPPSSLGWGLMRRYTPSIKPILRVKSGEIVTFDCLDASNGSITSGSNVSVISTLDFSRLDQVNGPIYVEGATPGDTLKVDVISVETADWGWTAIIPGFGLLADEIRGPALKIWTLNKKEGFAYGHFNDNTRTIQIPLRPFAGEMGVARKQPGAFSTIPPYHTGGNIDTKHLKAGSTLFLPVEVEGALFSIGDGHAAQGDGEVCGTAIETPIVAKVRLTVVKDRSFVKTPHFETKLPTDDSIDEEYYCTTGVDADIREATRSAVRHAIEFLRQEHSFSAEEAYMLCSVVGDLRMHEVDMPNYVIGMMLPKSVICQRSSP
ncbi:ATP-binding mismatch repair protein [Marasmius crinis-equi]|uniref:ATP-binding mismatch repair protein n=1 Tax=Marasmius crinis-equi TaxID=585013 RepID=A0ABR3FLH5_9AGAR